MTDQQFTRITNVMLSNIRKATPYDTGNLAMFATRSEPLAHGAFRIYVNTVGDHSPESTDGIAPYFVKVNYDAYIELESGRTVRNKNFQYWDNAVKKEVERIAKELGGVISVV